MPINSLVHVSAGSNISTAGAFGGYITINGVTCQKTYTGLAFPSFYWNCVNPGSPGGNDDVPSQAVSVSLPVTGLTAQLNNTSLYVIADSSAFNAFFGYSYLDPIAGLTLRESGGAATFIDVVVAEQYSLGTQTANQLKEATIHEYGHALDATASGGQVTSSSLAYIAAVTKDINYLDNAGAPCQSGGAGPFNGIVDYQTGQQFCWIKQQFFCKFG